MRKHDENSLHTYRAQKAVVTSVQTTMQTAKQDIATRFGDPECSVCPSLPPNNSIEQAKAKTLVREQDTVRWQLVCASVTFSESASCTKAFAQIIKHSIANRDPRPIAQTIRTSWETQLDSAWNLLGRPNVFNVHLHQAPNVSLGVDTA